MTATPATRALEAAGTTFELTEYDPPTSGAYGDAAVEALGLDPAATGKTLVALVDDEPVVAVVPVDRSLDLKALARAAGAKRASMSDPEDAERRTGYVIGGIAPLGLRSPLAVYVDDSLLGRDHVNVSGGRRGLELRLSPDDLVTVTDATVVTLSR